MAVAPIAPIAFSAADLALVAFMLVCIVAIGVLRAVRPGAVSIAGNIPAVGGPIAEALTRAFVAAEAALLTALHASLVGFGRTVAWLQAMWAQLTATLTGFAQLTYTAVHQVSAVTVPHLIALASATLAASITAARAYALQLAAAEGLQALGLFHSAQATAQALYAQGAALSLSLFRTAEHDAALAVAGAEAAAAELTRLEHAAMLATAATLTTHAEQLFAQALAATQTLELQLGGQLGRVAGAEADALRVARDALQTEIDAAKAATSALAVGSVAGLLVDVAALKALRCLKFCDVLADLGQFAALLDVGLIWLAVEEAHAHPQEFQSFIAANLAPALRAEWPQ